MTLTPQDKKNHWEDLALAVLFLVAVAAAVYFRFVGLNWDENQHLHPDERFLTMVETGIAPVKSLGEFFDSAKSSLNPVNRGYGFFVYGTLPIFIVRYVGEALKQTDYDQITLVGRQLSALADLGALLFLFVMARRLYGDRVAVLAALLSAAAVLPIQQSHFFTVDTFANLFVVAAFYFIMRASREGGWLHFAASGPGRRDGGGVQGKRVAGGGIRGAGGGAVLVARRADAQSARSDALQVDAGRPVGGARLPRVPALCLQRPQVLEHQPGAALAREHGPGSEPGQRRPWTIRRATNGRIARRSSSRGRTWSCGAWACRWGWPRGSAGPGWPGRFCARKRWRDHLLPWLWATAFFIYQGTQWVKSMRYILPVYPFFILFAAYWLVKFQISNLKFQISKEDGACVSRPWS